LREIFGKMMGEDIDQRAFELLRIGVTEFGRGEFLEMIVQEPGMIERGPQDQRFAARDGGASRKRTSMFVRCTDGTGSAALRMPATRLQPKCRAVFASA